jgi:hypothetical protein
LYPPREEPIRRIALVALMVALLVAVASPPLAADPLLTKAQRFRADLVGRHLSPEGLVLYRVDLRTIEDDLERGTYPDLADAPPFTGIFAATSCLRASLEDGAARGEATEDAARALAGLRFLMDVTGVRGLLARGARRLPVAAAAEGSRGRWFPGAAEHADWSWRGDVSLDQYANGLLPAVAGCRALHPLLSTRLVTDFAAHLAANRLRVVDPDGRVTRYGDLSWRSGLGFNSIAQLTAYAGFALAADLDPGGPWRTWQLRLRDRYRVAARSRTTNLRILGITNYSNDMMAWHLYRVLVPLARAKRDPALADLRHGMHRAWLRVRPYENAYFALTLCRVEPASCDPAALAAAEDLLARFPGDKRKLAPPEALQSVPKRWLPERKRKPRARHVVPIELRPPSSFEWKSSPYRVSGVAAAQIEYTGLDYLAAYWLLRAVRAQQPTAAPRHEGSSQTLQLPK